MISSEVTPSDKPNVMQRVHLFELHDLDWFPASIRDAGTDLLRLFAEVANPYRNIVPRLRRALARSGSREILDLCSGAGGPVVAIQRQLAEGGCPVAVTLTDKFPNREAFALARRRAASQLDFCETPVDATAVPPHLAGFRTLFTSLHHFPPDTARSILQDAVDQQRPIGAFEITERSILSVLGILALPVVVLLATPWVRPFRWSRLFWTYILPIVPFFMAWDGFVSCLRTYSVPELEGLVDGLRGHDYVWEIGREAGSASPGITYMIGYPRPAGG